jgi:antitoxin component HigA of HigAB toxin-antitoxin module
MLIKTELEYNNALLELERLMDIPEDELTEEQGDELETVSIFLEAYEKKVYPIDTSDVILPFWLLEFQSELEQTELNDSETALTEYMEGYYSGCRDTRIQIAAQLLYHIENNK